MGVVVEVLAFAGSAEVMAKLPPTRRANFLEMPVKSF